jgi:cytochrome oxidase Cu insertion factor (SCO1/SenC/PrrC family)
VPAPLLLAGAALVVAALVVLVLAPRPQRANGGSASAGGPSFVSTAASNLLGLDVLAEHNWYKAPGFEVTDQAGRPISLAAFRGKSVVLSFNDDRCADLCTLLAQDIVAADGDLGHLQRQVAFVGVNANPFYPQVSYVKAWTDEHGLGGLANWFFGTASPAQLAKIWRHYGVYVDLDKKDRTVTHSTEIFFISPAGRVVGIGDFGDNAANTALFGHAMARMAADLLPGGERLRVGGPSVPVPSATNATVGARAPGWTLPLLANAHRELSSAQLAGRYVVVNFWASTCTVCKEELPAMEAAYKRLAGKVVFVGVDVSDNTSAALGLAKQAGLSYSLVSDTTGKLAGDYRVPGLPFTAIVGPHGTVLVRHPGSFTAEQLYYVLASYLQAGAP